MTAREDNAPASFERVTVYLTPASSAALACAVEAIGDNRTDTINRAIQAYALMAGEVADGGRVLVQHADQSAQPAPDCCDACARSPRQQAAHARLADQPTTRVQRSTAKLRSLLAGGTTNAPEEG